MDATVSRRPASAAISTRDHLRREVERYNVHPHEALAALIGRLGPLEFEGALGKVVPRTESDNADFDQQDVELFERIAATPRPAPVELSQATASSYPPAFDADVMRWVPLVVPLLGVVMVLLTGAMWSVVG